MDKNTKIILGISIAVSLIVGIVIGSLMNDCGSIAESQNRIIGQRQHLARMLCNHEGMEWANCANGRTVDIQTSTDADSGQMEHQLVCCDGIIYIPDQLR